MAVEILCVCLFSQAEKKRLHHFLTDMLKLSCVKVWGMGGVCFECLCLCVWGAGVQALCDAHERERGDGVQHRE